ncbi:MAG: hypothetical protein OXC37_00950 [Bdellovibrionaceae bacterium]|nr:hypothetical protein [Pseudobdellovibrionaceae bacterium]
MKNNFRPEQCISSQKKKRKDFLKLQNECYLCGKSLSTHVEYLPQTYKLIERTQCNNCMTLVRVKNHSMQ